MSLVKKIRERSALSVGVVAVSLVLFIIGGDVLTGAQSIFGGGPEKPVVAEIDGEEVLRKEYDKLYQEQRSLYQVQTRGEKPVTDQDRRRFRSSAWQELTFEQAYKPMLNDLGMKVTDREHSDLVQGQFVHSIIRRMPTFQNPETKQFDRSRVQQFLRNKQRVKEQSPYFYSYWMYLERTLPRLRLQQKYENTLKETHYVTRAEAERQHLVQNAQADIEFGYVPYNAIPDSVVAVEEDELKKYYNEHQAKYEVEPYIDLHYAAFPYSPSAEDTTRFLKEMDKLKKLFAKIDDDSSFCARKSEAKPQPRSRRNPRPQPVEHIKTYPLANLPRDFQGLPPYQPGDVYGPYLNQRSGKYSLYKVLDTEKDTTRVANAGHILFQAEEGDDSARQAAKEKAQEVMQKLKDGADFKAMARKHSEGPSSKRDGNLGWFRDGQMVGPFNEAVMNASDSGLINRIVETKFGYHIINIYSTPTSKKLKLAKIVKTIEPGRKTRDRMYRKVDKIAATSETEAELKANIAADSTLPAIEVKTAEKLNKNNQRIGQLKDVREILRWGFYESDTGEVSPVFDLSEGNKYVLAVKKTDIEKGIAPLDEVRDRVTQEVRKEKKGEMILEKLGEGKIMSFKEKFPKKGKQQSQGNLGFTATSFSSSGHDPEAIGRVFGLKPGQRTGAFAGANGVHNIKVNKMSVPGEAADYTQYKGSMRQKATRGISGKIQQVLEEQLNIKDHRLRFN